MPIVVSRVLLARRRVLLPLRVHPAPYIARARSRMQHITIMSDDFGFTPVPASALALQPSNDPPRPVSIDKLQPPSTPLVARIKQYAEANLPADTLRHSMRVYAYGVAIATECFPEWQLHGKLLETWYCTAMLHDIGTTPENITSTKLSYEFFAGFLALELLQDAKDGSAAPREQAESVAEAIIRHQDIQDKGMLSVMSQLIQLATLLDNIGHGVPGHWVAKETIDAVNQEWSRKGWGGCLKATIEQELELKPYAMISRLPGGGERIMNNSLTGIGRGD